MSMTVLRRTALLCQLLTLRRLSHLARWSQDLRYPSSLVQADQTVNLVVGRCHRRLGQEEDLNRSRAWNAEELSSSSLLSDVSLAYRSSNTLLTTSSLRCNRTSPCSSCLKRGLADRCTGASNAEVGGDATGLLL